MISIKTTGIDMIIRGCLLMIIFFLASPDNGLAQTYFFDQYTPEHGLGSSKVYVALQEAREYIWLGTDVGLSRFDGGKFENYNVDHGLAAGGVRSIAQDEYGRVWFGHLNGGLTYYDGERFIRTAIDGDFISSDITSITQHGEYLWISTWQNGAVRFDIPGEGDTVLTGERYMGQQGLSDLVFDSYTDNNGDLFFIADNGIRRFVPEENVFEAFNPPGMTREWQFTSMLHDSEGNYWFGTHLGGLYKYITSTEEMTAFDKRDGLAGQFITCIMEDYRGEIWIGTDGGGITVFRGDEMRTYNNDNGLQGSRIFSIVEDREKNILITDYSEGLIIFKGDHIYSIDGTENLAGSAVYSVLERDNGEMWLATNGGISVYNPEEGVTQKRVVYNNDNKSIGDRMRFMLPDSKGNIWIGTEGTGVSFYEASTDRFRWDSYMNNGVIWRISRADRVAAAMTLDDNDNLWVGTTTEGLYVWYPEDWSGFQYTRGAGLAGNMITALYCDSDGVLWIGSELNIGLTKHKPGSDDFTVVGLGELDYIPRVMTESNDGRMIIGTESGLFILKNDSVELRLSEEDGLISNYIRQLLVDGDYLYIGTNRGLNRYDFRDGSIATYTRSNGFIGIDAVSNAAYRDSKGRLWFGTTSGVTILNPSRFHPVSTEPMTHLKGMMVNRQPREMTDDMELHFRERSLAFDYYSVCITNPDAVRYRVMLEGADDSWRPVTKQTTAYYSALNPGNYTFKVMASNSYGYWNEEPVLFRFYIKPPFYKTTGFIIGMIIVALAGIVIYIKWREKHLIKEKRILEDKVRERTEQVVHKSLIIEEKNRDITASIRYAERIQRAMLPPDDLFPDTFVMFMPKDIVSGDFFWMYDNGDIRFIAAVDCTGHGVPGAFMSIIGHNSLNKIVREYGITKPSAVLDQLNVEVVKALLQRGETAVQDGMDLSLIAYHKESGTLEFAGAYNPLYRVRDGEVIVHKADRFPIGMSTAEQEKRFTNVDVDIASGDMIYLFSDGYADQFGGPKGSKYKSANVKRLVIELSDLPVLEQKKRLEAEINEWKGDLPQIDDILFIGTRMP